MPVVDQRTADAEQAERGELFVGNAAADRGMRDVDQGNAHRPFTPSGLAGISAHWRSARGYDGQGRVAGPLPGDERHAAAFQPALFRGGCFFGSADAGLVGEIGRAVQQECRDRSRMPSSA
eukprot:TRINITY_DN51390_c0_g1_i1.p2 TRINITY_DN51390_c0_g1~~TRINITY_DN51390_c0_g1_i1.p2  ORF type:complete len:139 (+),score=23.22 TRINITY_DN51390_c0_g1_i1:57-419(+)